MHSYKYILLDWDGNLAQTLNLWPDALDIVLKKRGINLTRKDLIKACGGVAAFLSTHTDLSESEAAIILGEATEIIKEKLPTVELYPDAIDVLKTLKADGKKLAVITSSIRAVVEPLFDKFNLTDLFDAVICIEDTEHRKPHAEPIQKALEILGGQPYEAVMVGDTEKDILAGLNAGVDSVLFYPIEHQEFYSLEDLSAHNPTYIVSDFKDLLKISRETARGE